MFSAAGPGSLKRSPLAKINFFVNIYIRLFAALFRIPLWFPFLVLALFQAAIVYALANFYSGSLNGILYPILSKFYAPDVFHYPQFFRTLPHIYSMFDRFLLGPTIGILMIAVAVYKLEGYAVRTKNTFGSGFGRAVKLFFPLFFVWLLGTIISVAVLRISAVALGEYFLSSPRAGLIAGLGFHLFSYFLLAIILYAVPGIMISGRGLLDSLKFSASIYRSNFFLTFFIIAIPGAIGAIIDLFIVAFSPQIINLFYPELMSVLMMIRIALGVFINLFLYGAAVFVYNDSLNK